jgi:hypothetical protein
MIFFLQIIVFWSCNIDCEAWPKRSSICFEEKRKLFLSDSMEFKNIEDLLNKKIDSMNHTNVNKENPLWNKHSNVNSFDTSLLSSFKDKKLHSVSLYDSISIAFSFDYDVGLYNEKDDCPIVSYQIVYVKNNRMPISKSFYRIWHKLSDFWFLETTIS